MSDSFSPPGVAVEAFSAPSELGFRTGVAGFLCRAWNPDASSIAPPALPAALLFTSWADFAEAFRAGLDWQAWLPGQLLWAGVQGFFLNGGARCWVVLYDAVATGDQRQALDIGVAALADIEDVDLVCAPSLMREPTPPDAPQVLYQQLIWSCEQRRSDWFLILDAPATAAAVPDWLVGLRDAPRVVMPDQRPFHMARPHDAAVYYPWLVPGGDGEPPPGPAVAAVPASGHIAGLFARTDEQRGVHRSPANRPIEGVVDVVEDVEGVVGANPLRALRGRGIRAWGARTLSVPASSLDRSAYIGVRRLILTLDRWLARALDWTIFETNEVRTWVRIRRELNARLTDLFERGTFQGRTPDEAFYVKCDAENNPLELRAAGHLQVDVGVAPAVPNEFINIRLVRSAAGITVA